MLGVWIAGCLMIDFTALQNLRLAGQMINSAMPAASEIMQNAGREQMGQLLHHFAAEQYRYYFSLWGFVQLAGVLLLSGLLYFAAEKRIMPQILCLAIFVLVIFQLAINPELTYRGREADFPPGSLTLGTQARVLGLTEIWVGVEIAKVIVGGVLAAFLFAFKSKRRSRRTADPVTLVRAD
jgi:hypothetical protein